MTLETPAQVRHQLRYDLALARILGLTREERVEAMQKFPHPTIEERRPNAEESR